MKRYLPIRIIDPLFRALPCPAFIASDVYLDVMSRRRNDHPLVPEISLGRVTCVTVNSQRIIGDYVHIKKMGGCTVKFSRSPYPRAQVFFFFLKKKTKQNPPSHSISCLLMDIVANVACIFLVHLSVV